VKTNVLLLCERWQTSPQTCTTKKSDINKIKRTLKLLRDVGIADQQKARKQGRDNSIKKVGIQPHPTYYSTLKFVGWGCIVNCFMLSSLPCSLFFADLLSLHLVTF